MRFVYLNLAILATLGCGDSDGESGGGSGDAGSTSSTVGTTAATSSSSGPGSGSGSGSGDGTGSGAGCEPQGDLMFPLAVGRSWDFDMLSGGDCDGIGWTMTITGTETIGGREAFVMVEGCGMTDFTSHLSSNGQTVERWDSFNEVWNVVIEGPIEAGHTWAGGSIMWESVGEVTVPAGTFSDCWRATNDDMFMGGTTYCRGLGPVSVEGFELGQQLRGCT